MSMFIFRRLTAPSQQSTWSTVHPDWSEVREVRSEDGSIMGRFIYVGRAWREANHPSNREKSEIHSTLDIYHIGRSSHHRLNEWISQEAKVHFKISLMMVICLFEDSCSWHHMKQILLLWMTAPSLREEVPRMSSVPGSSFRIIFMLFTGWNYIRITKIYFQFLLL